MASYGKPHSQLLLGLHTFVWQHTGPVSLKKVSKDSSSLTFLLPLGLRWGAGFYIPGSVVPKRYF